MTTGGRSAGGALSFELANDLAEMPVLVEHLEGFCEQHGIGPEVVSVVNLALEEIITNIISYGYADGGDHRIRVDLSHDGTTLTARVEDDANALGPMQEEDPNISLGIHLVRTLMDEVTYSREQDHNVLCLRKATAP
jgi:anti-sigma regulatory factor (Ser/Thr protein kinase)